MKKFFILIGIGVVIGLSTWVSATMNAYERSYEQKLVGALNAVEAKIDESVDPVSNIRLHSPTITYDETNRLWALTGIAVLSGAVGQATYAEFRADIRPLCGPSWAPECWRIETLIVGRTKLAKHGESLGPISLLALNDTQISDLSTTSADVVRTKDVTEEVTDSLAGEAETITNERSYDLVDRSGSSATLPDQSLTIRIQEILRKLGYNPGQVDGVPGPKTVSAIIAYQRRHGLKADGAPSQQLLDNLIASSATQTQEIQQ